MRFKFKFKYNYRNISAILGMAGIIIIIAVWVFTYQRVYFEYHTELNSIERMNANLVKAFGENVRRNLEAMDEVLLFLKDEYETNNEITPAITSRLSTARSIPVVHISVVNEKGDIIASSRPEFLSFNIANREYFNVHLAKDSKQLYFSAPFKGSIDAGKWIFHINRRLNNPDGSFAGVVTIGVEPMYFANFYRQMNLGKDYGVTLVGRDGIIRVRQAGDKTTVGSDIRSASLFQHVQNADAGSYIDTSLVDNTRHIFSYLALPDYPLVVTLFVSEREALAPFLQRKAGYYLTAVIITIALIGIFGTLMFMAEKLRHANKELELKVEQRTGELQNANEQLQLINEELRRQTRIDGLTGIANRRYFDEYLVQEWASALCKRQPIGLIMLDIDYFKAYNDAYGHQMGDDCLKTIASILGTTVRHKAYLAARYGGEEFAIVLPNTDKDKVMRVAEELRLKVERQHIIHSKAPGHFVTVSLGAAAITPTELTTPELLISASDQTLYDAKRAGRNCSVISTQAG